MRSFHSRTAFACSAAARAPSASTVARGAGTRQGPPRHRAGREVRDRWWQLAGLDRDELAGLQAEHDPGDRTGTHQLPGSGVDRVQRGPRHRFAAHDRVEECCRCPTRGEQPRRDDGVEQRHRGDPAAVLLGDEREVDEVGTVAATRHRQPHGHRARSRERPPELGVEAARLRRPHAGRGALLLEQAGEGVPQLPLLEGEREVPAAERVGTHVRMIL